MKKKFDSYVSVEIPHLRHTVHFMDLSKLKGVPKLGAGYTCKMDDYNTCVFLQDIEKTVKDITKISYLAHEIMHAIQILCEQFSMKIENEQEHTAYLIHYLMDKVINK